MFLNMPQLPVFYNFNDFSRKSEEAALKTIDFNKEFIDNTIAYFDSITDKQFTTYTQKVSTFNQNVAEDAKKIVKSESAKTKA